MHGRKNIKSLIVVLRFYAFFAHMFIAYFMLKLDAKVIKKSALSVIAQFTYFKAVYLMMMGIV